MEGKITKKEQYIRLRVAGKTRKEVREIMGYTLKAESTYAARLSEEIENRKRLGELPPGVKLDGTPAPERLTAEDAERAILAAIAPDPIERKDEPVPEPDEAGIAVFRGKHAVFRAYLEVELRPVSIALTVPQLAEYARSLADETEEVARRLRGIEL